MSRVGVQSHTVALRSGRDALKTLASEIDYLKRVAELAEKARDRASRQSAKYQGEITHARKEITRLRRDLRESRIMIAALESEIGGLNQRLKKEDR